MPWKHRKNRLSRASLTNIKEMERKTPSSGTVLDYDLDYSLPGELIAQYPLKTRDSSRLLVLHKKDGRVEHCAFTDLKEYLNPGDLLILNDTKVIPARLIGKKPSGGAFELLLVKLLASEKDTERWEAMTRTSKPVKEGMEVIFEGKGGGPELRARAITKGPDSTGGLWEFELTTTKGMEVAKLRQAIGRVPLPPYIRREAEDLDKDRYQTVFAGSDGAVAAPTAGLHFTEATLDELRDRGVDVRFITLHTGPATFLPITEVGAEPRAVPEEYYSVDEQVFEAVKKVHFKGRGGGHVDKKKVVAVGSTVLRALETVFMEGEPGAALSGGTALFIKPGFEFRAVDALLTNFHLPGTSLISLVAAFAGSGNTLIAYKEAVKERYRFYSYGDCMLIV